MTVYAELDPMSENRTLFPFKGEREHITKVNIPNLSYPNQHSDTEIPYGSRNHIVETDTVTVTFNLDIESIHKARSIVKNVSRTLVKEKILIIGSTEIDTVNEADIYNTYGFLL